MYLWLALRVSVCASLCVHVVRHELLQFRDLMCVLRTAGGCLYTQSQWATYNFWHLHRSLSLSLIHISLSLTSGSACSQLTAALVSMEIGLLIVFFCLFVLLWRTDFFWQRVHIHRESTRSLSINYEWIVVFRSLKVIQWCVKMVCVIVNVNQCIGIR